MLIKRGEAIESLMRLKKDGVSVYDIGYNDGVKHAINHIDYLPSIEVIAEPPLRSDGIVSEHSNGTVSMSKQTWEDVKNEMIPKFIINKSHEELRQAYKDLLSDNQTLMADNRKLRAEVEELKKTNAGYTKVLAKSQDTANRFMRVFAEEMEIITFPDGTTRRVCGVPHGTWERRSNALFPVCSECGVPVIIKTWFCPHCGAVMDGGKNE